MLDVFGKLRELFKVKVHRVDIDNFVFSLHYRYTTAILVTFSLVVSSSKYFGDAIDCSASNRLTERYIDSYCWFNSYIVVPREPYEWYESHVHPATGSEGLKNIKEIKDHRRYKPYFIRAYQWIELILFVQAILFFVPRYLWRYCWEDDRIHGLTKDFSVAALTPQDNDNGRISDIAKYFVPDDKKNRDDQKYYHRAYAAKFTLCEILNFANVLAQFLALRNKLDMHWTHLLHDLKTSDSNYNATSYLARVFPNLVRCDIVTTTGNAVIDLPELCVLPINVFITKFYIILWFYFLVLTCITGVYLVYRLITVFSRDVRAISLTSSRTLIDGCLCPLIGSRSCGLPDLGVIRKFGFSDWLILSFVAKNMDPFSFNALVEKLNSLFPHRSGLVGNDKKELTPLRPTSCC